MTRTASGLGATLILLTTLVGTGEGVDAAGAFLEAECRVVTGGDSTEVVLEVVNVRNLATGPSDWTASLSIDCSVEESRLPWRTELGSGWRAVAAWTVTSPSRGFLFLGGRGGRATLTLPSAGWSIRCHCAGKSDEPRVRVFGVLIGPDGEPVPSLSYVGEQESFFARLLPFGSGHPAELPSSVRLRLAWEPFE